MHVWACVFWREEADGPAKACHSDPSHVLRSCVTCMRYGLAPPLCTRPPWAPHAPHPCRFDAVETLLEVLRMRRDHPTLDPSQYEAADKDFASFMACHLGEAECRGRGMGMQRHACISLLEP